MKINSTNNPQRAAVNELHDSHKAREPKQSSAPENSAQFQPTHAQDASQDIDAARVNDVRQAIADGQLQFHADRIADGIIASARELVADQ